VTVEPIDPPTDEGFISEEEGRRLYEEMYGKDGKPQGEGDESSDVDPILKAFDKDIWANPPDVDTPTGSIPNVLESGSEWPNAADVVDYFSAPDATPADAETSI
jgi:hypothetical protein